MKNHLNKIVIVGNSGSGKSYLANQLGFVLKIPVIHLDKLFWKSNVFSQKRGKEIVYQDILDLTKADKWILEGVFGDLASVATPRADTLIFLNKTWVECEEALLSRGPQTATQENFEELVVWAGEYWDRKTLSSFEGHKKIFEQFEGIKLQLDSRVQTEAWLKGLI